MAAKATSNEKPGFVSIWLQPERATRGAQPALSRQQIVRAAIAIADAEGFEAVTMRRIAADLGVGTMSLYWHVPNKDNLLELMRDELMSEVQMPDPPSGDWRADLRQIARETRANMKRHPWMMAIFASVPSLGPNLMRHADLSLAAIDGHGLDLKTMFGIVNVVDDYTIGFTLGEVNRAVSGRYSDLDDDEIHERWQQEIEPVARQMLATGAYPRLARLEQERFDFMDMESVFNFGLECVLDGIAVRIEASRKREAPPAPQ